MGSTKMASNFTDAVVNDRRKLGNCDLEGQPVGSTFFVHKVEVDGQMHVITDGGRVPEKVVAAGDSVKVCMHWKNHDCSCPGCYEQISFGLRGSPLTCEDTQAYSGVTCKTFNSIREDQEVVGQGSWWWKCADHTIEDGFKMLSIKVGKTCTRASEFDAGWGGCDTYQRGKSNYNWCDLDFDNLRRVWARDACSECGECVDGSRGRRNLEFFYGTDRFDHREGVALYIKAFNTRRFRIRASLFCTPRVLGRTKKLKLALSGFRRGNRKCTLFFVSLNFGTEVSEG